MSAPNWRSPQAPPRSPARIRARVTYVRRRMAHEGYYILATPLADVRRFALVAMGLLEDHEVGYVLVGLRPVPGAPGGVWRAERVSLDQSGTLGDAAFAIYPHESLVPASGAVHLALERGATGATAASTPDDAPDPLDAIDGTLWWLHLRHLVRRLDERPTAAPTCAAPTERTRP